MENLKLGKDSLKKAKNILLSGGVIIFPTDTVYGIAASIRSKKGLKRIFNIKKRPKNKPLPVLISNRKQLKDLVYDIPKETEKLIAKHWPGALTLIFKAKSGGTIGIRMPNHKELLSLIDECGPLAATSANISGKTAPVTADEVKIKADLLLDGGKCKAKEASTVIDVSENTLKILRKGPINLKS